MRIGIDLDNTLICYEDIFQKIAKTMSLVPKNWYGNKEQVRDIIRKRPNGEDLWQQTQGHVYSEGIQDAQSFPGALRFIWRAKHKGYQLFIVSHKTEFSVYDSTLNLRKPALKWLEEKSLYSETQKSLFEGVYFTSAQNDKVEKINQLDLDVFIDDLMEITEHPLIKDNLNMVHFGKDSFPSWIMIENHLLGNIDETDCSHLIIDAGLGTPLGCMPYNKGGNSSVWKVDLENNYPLTIKFYHNDLLHNDRRKVEKFALEAMWQYGIKNIPKMMATDNIIEASIFKHLEAGVISDLDIRKLDEIVAFIEKLKDVKKGVGENFPLASAACLCGEDIVEQIDSRLLNLQQAISIDQDLNSFINKEFNPFCDLLTEWAKSNWPDNNKFNEPLEFNKQILTPSDLGVHNMLENDNGDIFFIDFEYFGLDDPAKTVSDFLWQPKNNINDELGNIWVNNMINLFSEEDPDFTRRLAISWPLYGLCWCLIMLNEFRDINWSRRKQSRGYDNSEFVRVKLQQLKKAKDLLDFIKINYKEFPYSNIRVN